jgi:superfamily II DNA or RNA helicase
LYVHQRAAALRLAAAMDVFGGALLADAVGLGKTYVALALAARAGTAVAVVPATLTEQWRRAARKLGVELSLVTHEALSRRARLPPATLVVVDEAHRFRNPTIRRYDRLARDLRGAQVLLVTATPVVNRAADFHHLLRLFLPDHALAVLGVASLERALRAGRFLDVLHASGPLIVARTPDTPGLLPPDALPAPVDRRAVRAAPLAAPALAAVMEAVDRLTFPGFDVHAPELLRRHLLHRLASSVEAARETIRRHRAYCARAHEAALRGESLVRGAARRIFGDDDDGQIELLLAAPLPARDPRGLDAEMWRLDALLAALTPTEERPKEQAFRSLIGRRQRRKTLVFTMARATALRLAEVLDWRRVAVVTGRGARIATGRVVAEEAFALFAPAARGGPPPSDMLRVDVLIATDLASEGLDLQDADAVVHFDLPWTPVRLAQRVGRIARLGSPHGHVEVRWFVPPTALERRLTLVDRLRHKADTQLRLAVPSSSTVGRARVVSVALEAREGIARLAACGTSVTRGHAVASVPFDVVALQWTAGPRTVGELFGLTADGIILDPERLHRSVTHANDGVASAAPTHTMTRLADVVRRRLASASAGPCDVASRRLARRILRHARRAAAERERDLLGLLDQALARVHAGLAVGEERALGRILGARHPTVGLNRWVAQTPLRSLTWDGCRVQAALIATGPVRSPPTD